MLQRVVVALLLLQLLAAMALQCVVVALSLL
jgi:hypothetical protein